MVFSRGGAPRQSPRGSRNATGKKEFPMSSTIPNETMFREILDQHWAVRAAGADRCDASAANGVDRRRG